MKGDFSRDSYQPLLGFSRVLLQQGRVLLDADWNEQTAILLGLIRTLTVDIIGPHTGPRAELGFAIYSHKSDLDKLELPENQRQMIKEALDKEIKQGNVLIGPGRYYVGGLPCSNLGLVAFHEQPGRLKGNQPEPGARLLYLEVWERHVSANEVPSIHEVALGAADTATRAQIVWQVRSVPDPGLDGRVGALEGRDENGQPLWLAALGLREKGRLAAQTADTGNTSDLCELPAEARYRGRENRLYRVEVHQGGEVYAAGDAMLKERVRAMANGVPSFKWSRDNGSLAVPVESFPETATGERAQVRVSSLGRDTQSGIVVGSFVELVNDDSELGPGELASPIGQVYEVDTLEQTVTVDGLDAAGFERSLHPVLRRWDGYGEIKAGQWLALEDGIQIRFSPGAYRAGDYWLIPARAGVPGDVIWPRREVEGKPNETEAIPQGPHGIARFYAPLAMISADNVVTDLRCVFGPLDCNDPSASPPTTGQDTNPTAPDNKGD